MTIALLKAGADVNARSRHDRTPHLVAARRNQEPEMYITTLLKAGADVNATRATP